MASTEIATARYGLWLDGESSAAASEATFTRDSPYDGAVVAEFANGDEADARRAIAVARREFDSGRWPRTGARTRFEVLSKAARLLEERGEEIAARIVCEGGKPIGLARGEVVACARNFDFLAGACLADEGSAISDRTPSTLGLVLREPVGVTALITPWNFPLASIANKVAPALAAGCTVVLKPSHFTSSPPLILAEILAEAGLPAGVFNVITSNLERGGVVGQVLAGSAEVDKVAVTGSTATGRAVMRAAASNTKRISLELGGKSANIVFADAPFEEAARTAISGFCFNSGQQCSSGTRLLLQESIYDRFLEAMRTFAAEQVLGDPGDPATTMGPLINEDQLAKVLGYVEIGRAEGELITGGGNPEIGSRRPSLFVEPTIFAGLANSGRLAQEEVFGPVLAVIPFKTAADAVALANESEYGLAGGVWSGSIDTAIQVSKAVRTGKMFVNSYNSAGIEDMPHGGYKNSGVGREYGMQGLAEYQELKTVQIKLAAAEGTGQR